MLSEENSAGRQEELLFQKIEKITADHPVGLEGWCSLEKARAMARLILEHRPAVSVEIGVFGGRSFVAQALTCKHLEHGHVFGVDPWRADDALRGVQEKENIDWWQKLDYERIYRDCLAAVIKYDVRNYCTVLRMSSEQAVSLIGDVDVLHIDGNHSEEASTLDVMLYLPKVKTGGFIWFDDVDWYTTKNAVRLVEEACDKVREIAKTKKNSLCVLYQKR